MERKDRVHLIGQMYGMGLGKAAALANDLALAEKVNVLVMEHRGDVPPGTFDRLYPDGRLYPKRPESPASMPLFLRGSFAGYAIPPRRWNYKQVREALNFASLLTKRHVDIDPPSLASIATTQQEARFLAPLPQPTATIYAANGGVHHLWKLDPPTPRKKRKRAKPRR